MAPLSRKHRGFDVQRLTVGVERIQADPLAFERGVEERFTTPSWRMTVQGPLQVWPAPGAEILRHASGDNCSRSNSIAKWLHLAFNHELNNNLTLLAGARK
ncbi:hypothetical protein VC279_05630 [Xanthomonas sp. WHRI 10064A]|uniref:hypothetical protein n=1 Tax=unclassified Xanthomonas TaxID=2643310 RepID=UPI002B226705|nr:MULTISPECIES: hypothetical protein [unclassified Xanthomonas]MEA9585799.1 hypothetical protein [Xanthomonas sp. WHRI 10064B]MEA9614226.1 hypothetical protein [Xanthomonas sp. WHRI 10064A]